MALTQPVPAWADPVIGNKEVMEKLGIKFNPVWLNWFLTLIDDITSEGAVNHNSLSGLQGGDAGASEFYHLTAARYNTLTGNQSANTVFAGPATGAAAPATFRALTVADGATGVSTYATGDMLYASAINVLSKRVIGSAGQVLRSNGTVPQWSTATFPATATVNQILYATATDVIGGSANLIYNGSRFTVGNTTTPGISIGAAGVGSISIGDPTSNTGVKHLRISSDGTNVDLQSFASTPVRINNGGGGAITLGTNTTVAGALTMTGNTFDIGGSGTGLRLSAVSGNARKIQSFSSQPLILNEVGNNVGIRLSTNPTALLHIAAGSTAANSAPFKLTSGSLQTTAEAGAVEFLTDKYYATITTGAARKEITLNDAALTSGRIPLVTTNGRLTDSASATCDTSGNAVFAGTLRSTETYGFAIGGLAGVPRIQHVAGVFTVFTSGDTVGDLACQNISFGTRSALGAEVLSGYITITDSGGTSRKLGVVS